jgi:hypothetical protein
VIEKARSAGAREVRRLFPDSNDPELASLYTVDAANGDDARTLLRRLGELDAVEFVEPEVERKLER